MTPKQLEKLFDEIDEKGWKVEGMSRLEARIYREKDFS